MNNSACGHASRSAARHQRQVAAGVPTSAKATVGPP